MKANQLRNGTAILIDGVPMQVLEFRTEPDGVAARLQNLAQNSRTERKFSLTEEIREAKLERRELAYSERSGDEVTFLDTETYELCTAPKSVLHENFRFAEPGVDCIATFCNGELAMVELGRVVRATVAETAPAVAGAQTKPALLAGGAAVEVPLAVAPGEIIYVDTIRGEYLYSE